MEFTALSTRRNASRPAATSSGLELATISASRVSIRTERRMRIFARDTYLAADFSTRTLTVVGRGIGQKVPGIEGFGIEDGSWEDRDSLAAEHAAFYASILDGAPVLVGPAAGRRALSAALDVAAAMADSRAKMFASGLLQER